jgi:cytochrome oxidase assembly protein ShyY1
VVRSSEPRGSFVPDNNPEKGEWYWVDVPALAQATGLPQNAQLIEVLATTHHLCAATVAEEMTHMIASEGGVTVRPLHTKAHLGSSCYLECFVCHPSAIQVIDTESEASQARSSAPTSMEILAMRTRSQATPEQYPLSRNVEDLLTYSVMPHDHRNYALTWFALSGATAFLAVRAARARVR